MAETEHLSSQLSYLKSQLADSLAKVEALESERKELTETIEELRMRMASEKSELEGRIERLEVDAESYRRETDSWQRKEAEARADRNNQAGKTAEVKTSTFDQRITFCCRMSLKITCHCILKKLGVAA